MIYCRVHRAWLITDTVVYADYLGYADDFLKYTTR